MTLEERAARRAARKAEAAEGVAPSMSESKAARELARNKALIEAGETYRAGKTEPVKGSGRHVENRRRRRPSRQAQTFEEWQVSGGRPAPARPSRTVVTHPRPEEARRVSAAQVARIEAALAEGRRPPGVSPKAWARAQRRLAR